MCEKDDTDTGVCLYEGWYIWVETLPSADQISCSWGELNDEPAFLCKYIHNPASMLSIEWIPYTFMVLAETDEYRMNRIALAADKHVVETVTRWKYECERFIWREGPFVRAYDKNTSSYSYKFDQDECEMIIEVYDAGFTEPVNGSKLTGFHVVDDLDRSHGWFTSNSDGTGEITINIGRIEEEYSSAPKRDEVTRVVVAHERIHLADWLDDGDWDWILSWEHHHSPYGIYDETYERGEFIGEKAGPSSRYWIGREGV